MLPATAKFSNRCLTSTCGAHLMPNKCSCCTLTPHRPIRHTMDGLTMQVYRAALTAVTISTVANSSPTTELASSTAWTHPLDYSFPRGNGPAAQGYQSNCTCTIGTPTLPVNRSPKTHSVPPAAGTTVAVGMHRYATSPIRLAPLRPAGTGTRALAPPPPPHTPAES